MIEFKIIELWNKLEPLIEYNEYGEYLQSLNTVAKYGNSEENPKIYEEILKEFEEALVKLQPDPEKEVPTYLTIRIKLGNKKINFTGAEDFIKGGSFFPADVVNYYVTQDKSVCNLL